MNGSSMLPSKETEAWDGGMAVACVILVLSFLVGAPGNLLVIWTILRHIEKRSHTVVLILHLAVADLLVLVTLPLWIYSLAHSWVFGEGMCKAVVYVINSSMYGSVFIITLMSVERFVAIRYPFASISWRKKDLLTKVLLALWALAFLFSVPVIPTQVVDEVGEREQCLFRDYSSVSQEVVCLLLETLMGFVVPFSVLVVCYSCVCSRIARMTFKAKQKSTLLITSVVAVFGLCWTPHHVGNALSLVAMAIQEWHPSASKSLEEARGTMALIAGAMAFISSTANPLLYLCAARSFRSSLRDTGMRKLFRHISSSATGERNKELSFVSKRQSSTQQECTLCSSDSKIQATDTQDTDAVQLNLYEQIIL
ncbi:leukotriene B4 receptor 1 [Conger conger]|uniref:leukotriene B4 receptor 1 n=1 Tax=Conger conger TaxID=82655 RepID=UPI002A59FFE0|nr:leukotriene B4 receptor 1 [Conger conger]